ASHPLGIALPRADGTTLADSVVWSVSSPAAGVAISPPGGILLGTQGFDLVVLGPVGAATLALERVSFGGFDLTATLAGCAASGATATLGPIIRCPGVTGALLDSVGGGPHDLTLELDGGGQPVTRHVTWA